MSKASMRTAVLAVLALLLGACGGGSSDCSQEGGIGTEASGCGDTGVPSSVNISYPQTNAVEKLEGARGGFYERVGTLNVTDQNGNDAGDGRNVQLDAVDTIIATGTISGTDSLSGTTLTDGDPELADGTVVGFDQATVSRNSGVRGIKPGDLVLLISGGRNLDKVRRVAEAPTATNTLEVTRAYSSDYPNPTFGSVQYIVATSTLGLDVFGTDSNGERTAGVTTIQNGVGEIFLQYPGDNERIHVGCGGTPALDTRHLPTGSADVWVIAQLSEGSDVVTVNDGACFSSILPWALTALPTSVSGNATHSISLALEDAESVDLPFVPISATVSDVSGSITVNATGCTTQPGGACTGTIDVSGGAGGDSATVTFSAGNASATVEVSIPS